MPGSHHKKNPRRAGHIRFESRWVGRQPLQAASRRRSNSCTADIKKEHCYELLWTASAHGMGGRHHPAQQRQYYAKRRLAELRTICPDIPEDVLSSVQLRGLSFAVRRAGRGRQTVLRAETTAQERNRNGTHAQTEAEVRSTTEKSRQAHSQNSYHQPIANVTSEHQRCVP